MSQTVSAGKRYLPVENRRTLTYLAGMLTLISLIPLWSTHFFPSQNGPEYLLFIHMVKEFSNPLYNYSQYYEFVYVLIPNLLTQLVTLLFSYIFDWITAYKLTLSLTLIVFPLSILYFVTSVNREKYFLGFAGFLFSYNYYLFKGYDNFLFSMAMFFFYFGYLLRYQDELTPRRVAALAGLLFACYLSHVFSFLVAGLATLIYVPLLGKNWKRAIRIAVAFVPSLLFFGQYILSLLLRSDTLVKSHQHWIRYDPLTETLRYFVEMSNYSISEVSFFLFLIPLGILFWMVALQAGRFWKKFQAIRKGQAQIADLSTEDRLLLITAVFVVSYFILPREIAGWPKLNGRMLPFIFVGLIASARPFSTRIFNQIVFALFVIFSLTIYSIMTIEVKRIGKVVEDYVSGISVIERNKTLLPVRIEDYRVGRIRPLNWAFNYYNLFKGGATGRSVVQYTGRVPMKYRVEPIEKVFPRFDPLHPEQADMSRIRQAYDYILCWGRNNNIFALFQKHGFRKIYQQGKLTLLANERMAQEVGSF